MSEVINMEEALQIIKDKTLTYEQKVINLAKAAENSLSVLKMPARYQHYKEHDAICDLFEGNAPYRPRYILPDYAKFVRNGSEFLGLRPPEDLDELLNSLLILYHHVPSVTTFPVFVGSLDELIDPFLDGLSDEDAERKIRLFLIHIDRTVTDSFCHANIGPRDTRAGRLLLKVEKELQQAVPNMSMKVSADTPKEFILAGIETTLVCANPAFADHDKYERDVPGYGIASCYNTLPIGGGAYTLQRIKLGGLGRMADSREQLMNELLPDCMLQLAEFMNERIRFIVEESGFMQHDFLVKEGLISADKFTAMYGVVGLAEGVNAIMQKEGKPGRYGHDAEADDLAEEILQRMHAFADEYESPHCIASNKRFMLHAQVGIDKDVDSSPGVRIPIGEEPENLADHLRHAGRFQKYFEAGIGDIFPFEATVRRNPEFISDIIDGAFKMGVRYLSFYADDSDVIRVTGYLVKKSEIEKLRSQQAVLHDTTLLGMGAADNARLLERKVREDQSANG